MKVKAYCWECLATLARQVVTLSKGDEGLMASAVSLVDSLFDPHHTPTDISNRLLRYVKEETGVYDAYGERKETEFRRAREAMERLEGFFPDTFEGALRSSAFGNGGDFFVDHAFDPDRFVFEADLAKLEHQVYLSEKILILGDNVGDFLFDLPLVKLLRREGKEVLYAIKEHPVQNDMSMADAARFGEDGMAGSLISTGTSEVGVRRIEMAGRIKECWEDGSAVIAKGMGNYETISEFEGERPVIYVMKVKCRSVAETLKRELGEYIAITGGGHG